ncbi:MAG: chorismate synthase [Paludibacteraceae bacterium]|nr:chorismate synthase [Paludibacteraceae bacterium]
MANSIGKNVILTLFGESHGSAVGVVLDGMSPGIAVSEDFIAGQLSKRRPQGATETARVESDNFQIVSGVFNGYTTGAPICIIIPNENVKSSDYDKNFGIVRPSHADYTAHVKYCGFEDYRGGGHFSGRITAGIVAAGAIAIKALENKGIKINTDILRSGDATTDADITDRILNAKNEQDSVGGVVQTVITGVEAGVGEPWFDSLEGVIANAVFSIGGVKGIEFGAGFKFADMKGSQANDAFCINDGKIQTKTNNNGGINGGISNGMPIVFNTAVKPTPSISQPQQSVDFIKGEETTLEIKGRHDPAIIRRICIVISSLVAVVLCDMLACKAGAEALK